jgi:hypothetical protein
MSPKDTTPNVDIDVQKKKPAAEPDPAGLHRHDRRRRHGYRGYPNNSTVGGGIHSGTGFGGVGSTAGAGSPPGSGIITDRTKESIEELEEEDE